MAVQDLDPVAICKFHCKTSKYLLRVVIISIVNIRLLKKQAPTFGRLKKMKATLKSLIRT